LSEPNQAFLHGHSVKATEAQLKQTLTKLEQVSAKLETAQTAAANDAVKYITQAVQAYLSQCADKSDASTLTQLEQLLNAQFEQHFSAIPRLLARLLEEQEKRQETRTQTMFELHEKRLEMILEKHIAEGTPSAVAPYAQNTCVRRRSLASVRCRLEAAAGRGKATDSRSSHPQVLVTEICAKIIEARIQQR
jgi:hypothetical protein